MSPEDERKIATFYAQPAFREIRHLVAKLSLSEIDRIVRTVRRRDWKDFSEPT